MKNITRIALLFIAFFFSCEKDLVDLSSPNASNPEISLMDEEFQSQNFGNPMTSNFIGIIKNNIGAPLSDVQIEIGGVTTTTDRNGIFTLNNAPVFENFTYVKAKKQGYIDGSRVVIPKETGTNNIQIVLLEKEITATINSEEPSVVSKSGAKVSFTGDFIREDGSEYNGAVDVILNYVRPNTLTTFSEMPGSLFAQNIENEARALETYGMVSVNLFSSSGEVLNIDENNPATIEFPVDFTQTSTAPATINLWYFDEEQGYWKEDGQAVKNGNKYIANVTHFTWWACSTPLNPVQLCFSINDNVINPSNTSTSYSVTFLNASSGGLVGRGIINTNDGLQCVYVPRDDDIEVLIFSVGGACNEQLLHQEILSGFSTDATVDISFEVNLMTTTFTGIASDCQGNPTTDGYVFYDFSNFQSITDGTINFSYQHCVELPLNIQVYDTNSGLWFSFDEITLDGSNIDLGNISTCEDTGGIYNTDLYLATQEEVDNFGLLNISQINGNLWVGTISVSSDIVDLTPLNSLTHVSGSLLIYDTDVIDLTGLSNLTTVDRFQISLNEFMTSTEGIENLSSVNSLELFSNVSLENLSGFESITQQFSLSMGYNFSLSNLDGIADANIRSLSLSQNPLISSLNQFPPLTNLISLTIDQNPAFTSLEGLEVATNLKNLNLMNNPNLSNIESVSHITDYDLLSIANLDALADLSAFSDVTRIKKLEISNNTTLTSLNGLENLVDNEWMLIGLHFDGEIVFPSPNPNLTNLCAIQNLVINGNYIEDSTSVYEGIHIAENGYNPTVQDIIDGNCSQ